MIEKSFEYLERERQIRNNKNNEDEVTPISMDNFFFF